VLMVNSILGRWQGIHVEFLRGQTGSYPIHPTSRRERPLQGGQLSTVNYGSWPNSAVQQPMAGSSVWTSGVDPLRSIARLVAEGCGGRRDVTRRRRSEIRDQFDFIRRLPIHRVRRSVTSVAKTLPS
jgi:hypothetical protein